MHGGFSGCPPISKYYGKLNLSWEGGGSSTTRLKDWLDPLNTGTYTLDYTCTGQFTLSGSLRQQYCYNSPNTNTSLLIGSPNFVYGRMCPVDVALYSNSNNLQCVRVGTSGTYSFRRLSNGLYDLDFSFETGTMSFYITDECGSTKYLLFMAKPYSYSYSSGTKNIQLEFDDENSSNYKIILANANGIIEKNFNTNEKHLNINVNDLKSGIYYLKIFDKENNVLGTENIRIN